MSSQIQQSVDVTKTSDMKFDAQLNTRIGQYPHFHVYYNTSVKRPRLNVVGVRDRSNETFLQRCSGNGRRHGRNSSHVNAQRLAQFLKLDYIGKLFLGRRSFFNDLEPMRSVVWPSDVVARNTERISAPNDVATLKYKCVNVS